MRVSSLLSLVGATTVGLVYGYSGQAGDCAGNGPAIGDPHLNWDETITGSLEDAGMEVLLNGTALDPLTITEFTINEEHDLALALDQSTYDNFKGILFRLEGATNDDALATNEPDDGLFQPAELCISPVVGITHRSAIPKSKASMKLFVDQPTSDDDIITLDVTVVITNMEKSIYFYTGYKLKAVGELDASSGGGLSLLLSPSFFQLGIALLFTIMPLSMLM